MKKDNEAKTWLVIVWLAIAACAVPLWAVAQQYRMITIPALAEDDCAYYHGAYALADVVPTGTGVNCIYR